MALSAARRQNAQLRSCRGEVGIGGIVRDVQALHDSLGQNLSFLVPEPLACALRGQPFRDNSELTSRQHRSGVLMCTGSMRRNTSNLCMVHSAINMRACTVQSKHSILQRLSLEQRAAEGQETSKRRLSTLCRSDSSHQGPPACQELLSA